MKVTQKLFPPRDVHNPAKPLRTAVYCRVSTLQDAQHGSLTAQIDFYTKYVKNRPHWALVGIFADKASGRDLKYMQQYNQMIDRKR